VFLAEVLLHLVKEMLVALGPIVQIGSFFAHVHVVRFRE